MSRRVAIALIHYPVLDRQGSTVTAAITNLDVHDIARTAMTFGLAALFIVHPIAAQRHLVERIQQHWISGSGGKRIPDRIGPMQLVRVASTIEEAVTDFSQGEGPEIWTTSASAGTECPALTFSRAADILDQDGPPVMLLLGTGWGLAHEVHRMASHQLLPIEARTGSFNHLSVRAAAAIIADRLFGDRQSVRFRSHEAG